MSDYKMIALDMDGTLLNSQKEISKQSLEAINKAFDAGKEVILCTGRCVPELEEYIRQIPRLRYIVGISGALVYDLQEEKSIYINKIQDNMIEKILETVKNQDIMVHFLGEKSLVQRSQMESMEYYQMGRYSGLFQHVATPVEDIFEYYRKQKPQVMKVNLYHPNPQDREKTREKFSGEKLVFINAEKASLELSAEGTTKGTGLCKLCEYLAISLEQVIAVGDADNDLDVLSKAGLSIAMGNANESVKNICDVTVSDCDHDGCAEAIEKYLLK